MRVIALWCVSILFVTSLVFAEQKVSKDSEKDVKETVKKEELKMPPKDSVNYWTIRSQAMTDLMPLLTKKRKEMKENVKLAADYLLLIGKADEFAGSDIDVPEDPELYAKAVGIYDKFKQKEINIPKKPLTWEQTAELAMKFVLVDGYEPVEVEQSEMAQYKKICQQKEKYAKKVRLELRDSTTRLLKAWLFLETIDKQAGFRTYAYQQKQKAEAEKKEYYRQGRERLAQIERVRRLENRRVNRRNSYYGYYR